MKLYQAYNPQTATPFACNEKYMEFQPCEQLRPYIKCFWGTEKKVRLEKTGMATRGIVTPDTCMDIMFEVDFTNNKISNRFSGINNCTFETCSKNEQEKEIFTFSIRFYAWSAVCFSEESMRDVLNGAFDVGYHFERIKRKLEPLLFYVTDMEQAISAAECILLANLHEERENRLVLEAVSYIMKSKGNIKIDGLAREIHTSSRQLERLFKSNIGVSPKSLTAMMRYQYLWNDILFRPDFHVLDAVYQYGYTDQAHLLHDFQKYHSMNIKEAKAYAKKHVAFLQE